MNRDLRAKIGRVDRLYGINSSMEKPPGRYHHDANFRNYLKRRLMPAFPCLHIVTAAHFPRLGLPP